MPKLIKHLPLTPPQAQFRDATTHYKAFVGGRGAGKSYIGAYDLLMRAKPGRLYLVGGHTYKELYISAWRPTIAMARWLGVLKKTNQTQMLIVLGNGAEILFRSADDPDSFRGPNLSGVWLDEASLMVQEVFDIVIACLRECGQQGWLSATFTPKGRGHWTYKVFGTESPDVTLVRSKTVDNPFLPEGFEEMIRARYGPVQAAQELAGDFVDTEGAIFKSGWVRHYYRDGDYFWLLYPDGKKAPVLRSSIRTFLIVDLAASTKTTADYTVISTWGDDGHGNLLLLELDRDRVEFPKVPQAIRSMLDRWQAQYVGIESYGFQLSAIQTCRERGLPVRELKHRLPGSDKIANAVAATVRMSAGQIWLPDKAPWLSDFLDELLQFPQATHDDCVDVLAYAAEEMVKLYDRPKTTPPFRLNGGASASVNPYSQ